MKALLTSVLLSCSMLSFANQVSFSETELLEKANTFMKLKNKREQADSTINDIEKFIALLDDNFIDEHIKYNVTITNKDELRQGMVNKLSGNIIFNNIEILQMMVGRNVVMIKYTEHVKGKPAHLDKVFEYRATHVVSLEFNQAGLIKHIRRHHG